MLLFHQEGDGGGIHRTRTGPHHKAIQRGQAHGGIDDPAVLDGGQGGAVAEMAGDDPGRLTRLFAQQLEAAGGDIPMGGSMETIAADPVFFIVFVGQPP